MHDGVNDSLAFSFVDRRCLEVLVEQDHEHGVKVFFDVDATEALARLAVWKKATALDLKPPSRTVPTFGGVKASVARWRELHTENAGGLVFRDLAGDPKRLTGELAVPLRKALSLAQDLHDCCGVRTHWLCRLFSWHVEW